MMTDDETEWVRRFQAGEADGFTALFRHYGPRVYRFCHRLCGDAQAAEDLTQDVFVAARQGAAKFERRASVKTWLFRIAVFQWRTRRRDNRLTLVPLAEECQPVVRADMAQAVVTRLSLENALNALPDNLRAAFLLVKSEQLTYKETAGVLQIPMGTVQWRVAEAVRRLRVLLADDEENP